MTDEARDKRPTWVATGPLLPAGMGIAVLIAAILNPSSILLWVTAGLCAIAVVVVISVHLVLKRKQEAESGQEHQ